MHIDTSVIAQAASRATELGLGEAATAAFIDDFIAGHAQGAAEVRARVGAILNSDEAKARPNAALKLALSAETITPDEAVARLSTLPSEAAPRAAASAALPTLADRAGGMPEIGAGGPPLSRKEAEVEAIKAVMTRAVEQINAGR